MGESTEITHHWLDDPPSGNAASIPSRSQHLLWGVQPKYIVVLNTHIIYIYTLWLFNIAMENCPFIDVVWWLYDLPINNGEFL